MKHRNGISIVIGTLAIASIMAARSGVGAQPHGDAKQFVERVAAQVVATIKDPRLTDAQRPRQYGRIFDYALDIQLIARVAIGHHLRDVTPEQKAQYFRNFRRYIIDIYAGRFGGHDDARLEVLSNIRANKGETLVNAKISGPRMSSKDTVFRVRRASGGLKIVDVMVDGVSLVLTKRSEFNSIVYNHGIDKLLHALAVGRLGEPDPTHMFKAFLRVGKIVRANEARVRFTGMRESME